MLSLNTGDLLEAMKRLPIVDSVKMSWNEYQKTFAGFVAAPETVVHGATGHIFSPPITWKSTKQGTISLIEQAIKQGIASYKRDTGEWVIENKAENYNGDILDDLAKFKNEMRKIDNLKEIKEFYKVIVPQLYVDKDTANRNSEIWLTFLEDRKITSWSQITEPLLVDFKDWRKKTKMSQNGREGVFPSALVVNRHMRFLNKSFNEARDRGYLKLNPIRNWKPDSHTAPLEQSLTVAELFKVLSDERLPKNYLMNGLEKVFLDFRLLDFFLLLFTSCKRRKEIVRLQIEGINYENHYAHYVETKNSSKGTQYSIHKAFWLTSDMESLLKRIIGKRTSGPAFYVPAVMKKSSKIDDEYLNADYISGLFKDIVIQKVPKKDISLQNLRHTATDILEKAGLTDEEIDAVLGHHEIKTALPFYKDRSADAIARRLSGRTKKGVVILSDIAKEFFRK